MSKAKRSTLSGQYLHEDDACVHEKQDLAAVRTRPFPASPLIADRRASKFNMTKGELDALSFTAASFIFPR
jgi:hypothetical protein